MDQKTCYYCGTKYPLSDECCPLCGQTEIEPEALDETPVEITAETEILEEKNEETQAKKNKRANVISTIICVILAIAVVAGTLFILNTLGVLNFEKEPANPSSLTLPVEDATSTPAEVLCESIDLEPGNAAFNTVGATVKLSVTVEPVNCTQEVIYSSSDDAVASVSDDGVVTCVGNGTAEITVSCGDFAKSMDVVCEIEEEDVQEDSNGAEETTDETQETAGNEEIKLSLEDFSLFTAGETAKISVTGVEDASTVQWTSSDESVATVDGGKVTAVGSGTATISASVGGTTLKCIVRCKLPADAQTDVPAADDTPSGDPAIFLSAEDVTLAAGESFRLILNGDGFTSTDVAWTTTDSSVCSVDDYGNVTGHSTGTAKIIVEYQGIDYICIIRCK